MCRERFWGHAAPQETRDSTNRGVRVTGDIEAHIIALTCGDLPKGYSKWTLSAGWQVDSTGLLRLDLTPAGQVHPKNNEYKPHLKKC